MTTTPAFGQVASDYVPTEIGDDIWIRTFKDPTTQIRIAPCEDVNAKGEPVYGADAWPTEREHYDDGAGSFPCGARFGLDCPGCSDTSPKVRERRRQYYINALDENGELRVYKLGVKLFKTFQARQERALGRKPDNLQPLSDRDYLINRMGQKLETTYDPEPGDEYEVDWTEVNEGELHDIKAILLKRWNDALEHYGVDGGAKKDDPEPEAEPEPTRKTAAAKKTAPAKKAAPAKAPEPEPEDPAERYGSLGATPTEGDIEDATTTDLKKFLDGREAEYPPRAPRGRLEEIAKEVAATPPF